jgi:ATP-dependent helicase/nuclease subunit B
MTDQLQKISASKIKLYRTCQRRYYYRYLLPYSIRPEDELSSAALTGKAIHKIIEQHYRNRMAGVSVEDVLTFQLQKLMVEEIEKHDKIKGHEWLSKALADGKKMLNLFDWDRWKPVELEYEFTLPFPNRDNPIALMTGFIDMISQDGDGYVAVDWKSGQEMPTAKELANDPQFIIYAWALREIYNKLPENIYWYHLRNGKLLSADVINNLDTLIDRLIPDVTSMIKSIITLEDNPRRLMDKVCVRQCPFFDKCYITPTISHDE